MKKKLLYLMVFLFVGGPILQSCGSSKRGCKKMRKYRTYASCEPTKKLTYPRTKY